MGNLKGIHIARNCPAIYHHFFADDLLIFGKATFKEACSISSCLNKYCVWSSQTINGSKSSIWFSKNTNSNSVNTICYILPYKTNPSSSIYLGLPILTGSSKFAAFQGILDKVQDKIEGWRAKTLSQADRLVLIKSVAAAIPSYAMSSFVLPSRICSSLDRSFKNFW